MLFDLNDEKSGLVAEILGNKTCKKMLSVLADKELSENDMARELKMPINTLEYNLKKLLKAGLVEEAKGFFWSVKGKKIKTYKLANKKIVISTKSSFKSLALISSALVGGILFGSLKLARNAFTRALIFYKTPSNLYTNIESDLVMKAGNLNESFIQTTAEAGRNMGSNSLVNGIILWILIGLITGAITFFIYNKIRERRFKKYSL